MSKKIILILAHKDLDYINYLINKLNNDNFEIYLHLDSKSSININDINSKAIVVKNRIDVRWGEFSQVEATLSGLKQIIKEQKSFSHIILISGQDLPIKSNQYIYDLLEKNLENNFMQYFPIPNEGKYSNFKWRYSRKHYPSNELFFRKINSIFIRLGLIKKDNRKLFSNYKYYWGSQWWILNKEAIEYILEQSTTEYLKYFKYVFCSDEMYFQMLLLNSNKKFNIINDPLKYMKWEEYNHPKILTLDEYEMIIKSDDIFCRKIDSIESRDLLDKLQKSKL